MSSIAIRQVGASSALAKVVILLACRKLQGAELGPLVRAITEGLVLGQATCAIVVILAHLQLDPT